MIEQPPCRSRLGIEDGQRRGLDGERLDLVGRARCGGCSGSRGPAGGDVAQAAGKQSRHILAPITHFERNFEWIESIEDLSPPIPTCRVRHTSDTTRPHPGELRSKCLVTVSSRIWGDRFSSERPPGGSWNGRARSPDRRPSGHGSGRRRPPFQPPRGPRRDLGHRRLRRTICGPHRLHLTGVDARGRGESGGRRHPGFVREPGGDRRCRDGPCRWPRSLLAPGREEHGRARVHGRRRGRCRRRGGSELPPSEATRSSAPHINATITGAEAIAGAASTPAAVSQSAIVARPPQSGQVAGSFGLRQHDRAVRGRRRAPRGPPRDRRSLRG